MHRALFQCLLAAACVCGCAGVSSFKSSEVLDERTGVTVGALREPLEFVEAAGNAALADAKRASFAYLGPLEWDRSGDLSYGLWIHVAPGNDRQVADIRAPGAVKITLDDGVITLAVLESPPPGSGPYRPVASWGQTAYYGSDALALKRMAHSGKLALEFRAADGSAVAFTATRETGPTLLKFAHAQGLTDD
jgi:hypothetical protein